jgi:hypothetical protein
VIVRSRERSWVERGSRPALRRLSMNFAEVPNNVIRSCSARSNRTPGPGCSGLPSYSSSVAPEASPLASQFHIIQPSVVK